MSENLDLVRSIYVDWERGDFSRADWADPDIEFVIFDAISGSPVRSKGLREMARGLTAAIEVVGEVRTTPVEYRELDTGRVLVFVRRSSIGKRSGIGIEVEGANLFQISEGKVTRLVTYWDRDRALADLGVEDYAASEESTTPDLVELARLALAGVSRGDFLVYASPDIVVDTAGYGMGTFKGRESAIGFFTEWTSSFEDLTVEADEILDLGHGVVLTVYHQEGRPIGVSKYVRVRSAMVMLWVGGVIVRNTIYPETDIDEARAAAERLAEERG